MRIMSHVAAIMFLSSVSLSLFAQDEKNKKERPAAIGGAMTTNPVLAALDTDKNGTLSAAEIALASKSLLKLDKNGDGVLTSDELRASIPPTASGSTTSNSDEAARMFQSRDTNGDGKLSKDELPTQMKDRLEQLDQNGDGSIDKTEFGKVADRLGSKGKRVGKGEKDGSDVQPKNNP